MTIEIKVPVLPESVADASIATWHVKAGDAVKRDQNLVDIETDKVVLEVVAPADGTIGEILNEEGATVLGEQVIAKLEEGGAAAPAKSDSSDSEKSVSKHPQSFNAVPPSTGLRLKGQTGSAAREIRPVGHSLHALSPREGLICVLPLRETERER